MYSDDRDSDPNKDQDSYEDANSQKYNINDDNFDHIRSYKYHYHHNYSECLHVVLLSSLGADHNMTTRKKTVQTHFACISCLALGNVD